MTADYHSHGRKLEQAPRSGNTSLGSAGEKNGNPLPSANRQSDTRTDDLLSGGVTETERSSSFQHGHKEKDLAKGLGQQPGNQQ